MSDSTDTRISSEYQWLIVSFATPRVQQCARIQLHKTPRRTFRRSSVSKQAEKSEYTMNWWSVITMEIVDHRISAELCHSFHASWNPMHCLTINNFNCLLSSLYISFQKKFHILHIYVFSNSYALLLNKPTVNYPNQVDANDATPIAWTHSSRLNNDDENYFLM